MMYVLNVLKQILKQFNVKNVLNQCNLNSNLIKILNLIVLGIVILAKIITIYIIISLITGVRVVSLINVFIVYYKFKNDINLILSIIKNYYY